MESFVYGLPQWRYKKDGTLYLMIPVLNEDGNDGGGGGDDADDGDEGNEDGDDADDGPGGNGDENRGPDDNNDGPDVDDGPDDHDNPDGHNDDGDDNDDDGIGLDVDALIAEFGGTKRKHDSFQRDAEEQLQGGSQQSNRDAENGDHADDEPFPPTSKDTSLPPPSEQSTAPSRASKRQKTQSWPTRLLKGTGNNRPKAPSKVTKPARGPMGVADSPLLSRITERSELESSPAVNRDDKVDQEKEDESPHDEDVNSEDTDSDIDQETLARDRRMTDTEYRASLNPLERDFLDYMNETPEERKRKREEEDDESDSSNDSSSSDSSDDQSRNVGRDPRRSKGSSRDSGRKSVREGRDRSPPRKKSKGSFSLSSIWHTLGDNLLPSLRSRSHQGQHRGAMKAPSGSSPSHSSSSNSSPNRTSSSSPGFPPPSPTLSRRIRELDPKRIKRIIRETKASEYPEHPDDSSGSEPDSIRGWSPDHDFGPHLPGVDVPEGTRTRGPTSSPNFRAKVEKWGRQDARFISSHHGFEEGWVGVRPLGSGGYGRAGLWEKRSADGQVLDRVCIKQIKLPREQFEGVDKVPPEVKAHENLNQWHNPSIVGFRGHRRYPKSRALRIYSEYCEFGDLNRLIAKYRIKGHYFPEPFIWETFHHLAVALQALGKGPTPRLPNDADNPDNELKTLWLHRDIKPDNVFLAAGESFEKDSVPVYPRAKLGDFGGCKATGEGVGMPSNPWQLKGMGTEGYKAPEQKMPYDTDHRAHGTIAENWVEKEVRSDWPKCGQHTNIWGVAAVIYKMIKLTEVDHDFYRKIRSNEVLPKITTRRSPDYSSELRDLVHQCLKFDPKDRPTLAELLKSIESERNKFFQPWSEGSQMDEAARVRVNNDELNAWAYGPWRNEEKLPLSDYFRSHWLPEQTAFDQEGPGRP
ncbi:MAG: hypothetical protein Q9174_004889 [Haloplaca sp. 1 TL-2023]